MREFHGVLPWHFGGDPWFTYAEIEALSDATRQIAREHEQANRQAQARRTARRPRRR